MFRETSMCRDYLVVAITVTMLVSGCASRHPSLGWTPPPSPSDDHPAAKPDASMRPIPGQPLSMLEAINMALIYDTGVIAAKADLRVSEHLVTSVKRQHRDPELRLAYGEDEGDMARDSFGSDTRFYTLPAGASVPASEYSSSSTESTDRDAYRIALRVFPRNPWEQSARVSQARAEFHGAEAALHAARTTVAAEVCRAYTELVFADQDVMLAEALVDARREMADHGRELAEQGQTTLLESADTLSRYLRAISDHARSVEACDEARAALAQWLNMPVDALRIAWEGLPLTHDHMEQFSMEQLEEMAIAARADVAQLGWARVAADAAVKEMKSAYIPWISHVQASYGEQSSSGTRRSFGSDTDLLDGATTTSTETSDTDSDREEWEVSAAVALPVFSWWSKDHRLALAERDRALLLETQAIEQMRGEIRDACGRLSTLSEQRKRFDDAATPVIKELEAIIHSGESTPSLLPAELVRLREQVIEMRRLALRADKARAMAQLDLCAALGGANLLPGILTPAAEE